MAAVSRTHQRQIRYGVLSGLGGGIWAGPDRVRVRYDGRPFLVGIDPVAHRVVASVTANDLPSGGEVLGIGRQLWATAYDDATLIRLRPPAQWSAGPHARDRFRA
jgi:hypothetical protein